MILTSYFNELNISIPHTLTGIEIMPDMISITSQITDIINGCDGACLIIDYGKDIVSDDTLRGIERHKICSPLKSPGLVDLSVDVHFGHLKAYIKNKKENKTNVFGPIPQREFLIRTGIKNRLLQLAQNNTMENQEKLASSTKRLLDKQFMGSSYKFMALSPREIIFPFNKK